jgi:hypothetical protein
VAAGAVAVFEDDVLRGNVSWCGFGGNMMSWVDGWVVHLRFRS